MANKKNSTATNKKDSIKKQSMREKAHDGIDKMMDNAESVRDNSKERIATFKENASIAKEKVEGYIQENPKASVLIAAGVGAAAGAVTGAVIAASVRKKKETEV